MGKNKLARFTENKQLPNVIQPTREEALNEFHLKGKWRSEVFKTTTPLFWSWVVVKENIPWGLLKLFQKKTLLG